MAHRNCMIGKPAALHCELCGDRIVWDKGNGGQWLGAYPPRDWAVCHGSAQEDAPKHRVADDD